MPQPEGGRQHERVIDEWTRSYTLDGWRVWRPRTRRSPIIATREDKILIACPTTWFPYADYSDADAHHPIRLRSGKQADLHAALDAEAAQLVADGWRVARLYRLKANGYVGGAVPDAVAVKRGRLIAFEAYSFSSSTVQAKLAALGDFDEVVVSTFPGGGVYDPSRPPQTRTKSYFPRGHKA